MTECTTTELQDLLPDFVSGALDDITMARVSAHVASCPSCADDLEVLRTVRAMRPRVPVPDVQRIVAALPVARPAARPAAHPAAQTDGQAGPVLVRPGTASPPPSMQRRPARGTILGLSVWRMAATLGVVIAGGTSLLVARRGIVSIPPVTETRAVADSGARLASAPLFDTAETVAVRTRMTAAGVSISYGDLGDYTEDELQRMIDRLEQWDGATSTEPLPGVPIIATSGGSSL